MASFLQTMPLIANMRSPALRPRHWAKLEQRINARADPADASFTLEAVLSLRLDQHAALVSALATTATKELSVEMTLEVSMHAVSPSSADAQCGSPDTTGRLLAQGVSRTWEALQLDIAEHNGTYMVRGEPLKMTQCLSSRPASTPLILTKAGAGHRRGVCRSGGQLCGAVGHEGIARHRILCG